MDEQVIISPQNLEIARLEQLLRHRNDDLDAARARIAELEGELAAAEGTIRALEDPEVRVALTEPTSGDYGPVPDPREGE